MDSGKLQDGEDINISRREAWPDKVVGAINEISDRQAMGLSESYTAPLADIDSKSIERFSGYDKTRLVSVVTDPDADVNARLTAGALLSLKGDPRLTVHDPEMINIPAGLVKIGTELDDIDVLYQQFKRFGVQRNWIEKEAPRFQTDVNAFKLARYPVTNAEYKVFLEETGHAHLPSSWLFGYMSPLAANHPVYTVTPSDADAYVAWLAEVTGRAFRLPTEYEWEYAATEGQGSQYPWGDDYKPDACNTMETGLLNSSPIGMFPKGDAPFGHSDMAGNVEEYVSTCYHAYPGAKIVEDDLFKKLGFYRIARGGAFNRFIDLARNQRRHGAYPKSLYAIGFRVAEDL